MTCDKLRSHRREEHFLGSARAVVEWRVPLLIVLRNSALSLSRNSSLAKSNFINYSAALNERKQMRRRRESRDMCRNYTSTCKYISANGLASAISSIDWRQVSERLKIRAAYHSLMGGFQAHVLCVPEQTESVACENRKIAFCWRGFAGRSAKESLRTSF